MFDHWVDVTPSEAGILRDRDSSVGAREGLSRPPQHTLFSFLCLSLRQPCPYHSPLTMKITTGAAVLGMVASTQAFHVPLVARSSRTARLSMSAMTALSDAEVRVERGCARVSCRPSYRLQLGKDMRRVHACLCQSLSLVFCLVFSFFRSVLQHTLIFFVTAGGGGGLKLHYRVGCREAMFFPPDNLFWVCTRSTYKRIRVWRMRGPEGRMQIVQLFKNQAQDVD